MAAKTVTKDIITLRGSAAIVSEFFGIILTLLFIFPLISFIIYQLMLWLIIFYFLFIFHQSSGYAANRFELDPLFSNFVYHIFYLFL
jgi:cation transporter-like permease